MNEIICMVRAARNGDDEAMVKLIDNFKGLINKYTRLLNYDEDCRSDLTLKFISLVKFEINLERLQSCEDKYLIGYIQASIANHYVYLLTNKIIRRQYETLYDQESLIEMAEKGSEYAPDSTGDSIVIDLMKSVLTEREFMYIKLIVIDGYTAEAISGHFGVSKQAVNQCKRRGLKKLKKIYILID